MQFQPIPMLSIFLVVLLQFNLSNGSIFLPPPKEWKLPDLNVLNRPLKKSILNLDEHWRTWLLTHSNVSDLQFQQSLDLNLTVVERSTHVLTRQILTEFPTMILIGGYVRDVVINNGKSFNNQLDFYLRNDEKDGELKTAITDVAASIQDFGTKNNLVVASPVCVATTTKGRCTKLNVELCAVVDGTTFDNLDKCGDDATEKITEKITIRLAVGAFESVKFAANGLTLQCDVGVSTVDVDILDVAKAVNDVRNKILELVIGHLQFEKDLIFFDSCSYAETGAVDKNKSTLAVAAEKMSPTPAKEANKASMAQESSIVEIVSVAEKMSIAEDASIAGEVVSLLVFKTETVSANIKNETLPVCPSDCRSLLEGLISVGFKANASAAAAIERTAYINTTCIEDETLPVCPLADDGHLYIHELHPKCPKAMDSKYGALGLNLIIVWLCSYYSKTKLIKPNKRNKRQGKHLPPERRKFIRFPGDGTGCNGKEGSFFFKCKWLFLFVLVSFNPVMSESLISSAFGDVENLNVDESQTFTGAIAGQTTTQKLRAPTNIHMPRQMFVTLKKELDALSPDLAKLDRAQDRKAEDAAEDTNQLNHGIRFPGAFSILKANPLNKIVDKKRYAKYEDQRRLEQFRIDQAKRNKILYGDKKNVVSEKEKEEIIMAKELSEFTTLKQNTVVNAALENQSFKDAQLNVEKYPNNPEYLEALKFEIAKVTIVYKQAIAEKKAGTTLEQLAVVVDKGIRDLLVIYDSVWSMIVHNEGDGSKKYRTAIEQFIYPEKTMKQSASDPATLFQHAAQNFQLYKEFVEEIKRLVPGAEKLIQDHLKKVGRVIEKSELKGQGNANGVFDILRAMLKLNSMGEIAEVLDILARRGDIVITRVKDRFFSQPSAGGWRDCMINFYFKTDPNQHICELQLAHSQMYTARKQFPGHAVYNKVRNAIEMSKLFDINTSVNEDFDNDDSSDDGDDDSDDSSTSLRFRATRFKGQQVQTTATDLVNVIEISNELLDDNDCKDGLEYQGGVRQDDSLARCQKPACEIKEEKEGETTPECTACVFPRPVRDMVTKQCRRKQAADCEREIRTMVVTKNKFCWKFNETWTNGTGQIIHFSDTDGDAQRNSECLDKWGRNYAKNSIDPVLQECIHNQVGHVGVWGRQFEDVCSMYTGGQITYNEAATVAKEIYAVNQKVPSEVLGGKMKNQRFSLRTGVGWDAASELIGTELTEKIGWMAEAGQMSIDPTVVSGFNETLLYWKKINNLAFKYALPKSCEKCMGLDAIGEPTPWTKPSKCTHVEENRCKCNDEDDPEHLCPHYLETGDNPLDVYATLVKIEATKGDDKSGMFEYNEDCGQFYNKELCTVGLVPKPLLEYGYFPVPIPRFEVPTGDGNQLATFLCPWPLWISNLLPNGAKLDEKLKLTKENFGRQ